MYTPQFEHYVRSQVQISEDSYYGGGQPASGYRFNAEQALDTFGDYLEEIDKAIIDRGSFVCLPYQRYYQKFLHSLLVKENMTYEELDRIFKFKTDLRNSRIAHSIWDWVKICNYFNINIISLGVFYDKKNEEKD